MFWPKGKAMPKYFFCRMVSNFLFPHYWPLVPSEFPAQRPVTRSSSELISYIPAWYDQQLVFIADLWYFLGKQWKCKMKMCQTGFRPTPHGFVLCLLNYHNTTFLAPWSWVYMQQMCPGKMPIPEPLSLGQILDTVMICDSMDERWYRKEKHYCHEDEVSFCTWLSCQWKNFTYNSSICTGQVFPVSDHMLWEMLRHGRNLAYHSQYLYWESLGDIPGVWSDILYRNISFA